MLQRFFTYIAGVFLLLIAGLVAAPVFIDMGKYKKEFTEILTATTGVEPIVEGDLNISFFPSPSISMKSMMLPNIAGGTSPYILRADAVQAEFSFTALLHGEFKPNSIVLLRPIFNFEVLPDGQKNWVQIFKNNKLKDNSSVTEIPKYLKINNGTAIYQSKSGRSTVEYIDANIEIASAQGPYNIAGTFMRGATKVKFSGNMGSMNENSASVLNIESSSFIYTLKGNYIASKGFELKGTSELHINNLANFAEAFFIDDPVISKIKSAEKLDMTGNFAISGNTTKFSNIKINSESIKGNGNLELLYEEENHGNLGWDIGIDIDSINIDNLTKQENISTEEYPIKSSSGNSNYKFDLPTDLLAQFNLIIKEIKYNGGTAQNIKASLDIFNGSAVINSLSANLPGNSEFNLSGSIENNGIRPLLIGKASASGDSLRSVLVWLYPEASFVPESELNEFLFSCNLHITPKKMLLSNIYGSVDRTLLNGSLLLHPSDTIPSINADIKIDRLDLDRYGLTKQAFSLFHRFVATAKDMSIDSSWLQLFGYKLTANISGDELVFNKNTIENISTNIGIVKGLMGIQNIKIDSDLMNLRGKVIVNYSTQVPTLDIKLASTNIDFAALVEQDREDTKNSQTENSTSIWSQSPINLMGIWRFGGKLDINLAKIKYKSLALRNVMITGKLDKDIFSIGEMKATIGNNGIVKIKGSVGVSKEAPSIGVSILAQDVRLQDIMKMTDSKNKIEGTVYFGGVIKTFGLSLYNWINELKLTAKLSARNVIVQGIDIPTIIEQSRKLYSAIDMNAVIKEATSSGSTQFNSVDGNLTAEKSILQTNNLALSTERSRGVFAGNISLHNLKMKGVAKIDYIPEFNKNVTLRLNLDGTIPDNVASTLDSSSLEEYITSKASK